MRHWIVALACLAGSGCYLQHEAPARGDAATDAADVAPRPDAPASVDILGTLSAPRIFPRLLLREGEVLIAAGAGFTGAEPVPLDVYDLTTREVHADASIPSGPVGAAYFLDPSTSALMFAGGLGFDEALAPLGPASVEVGILAEGRVTARLPLFEGAGWPLVSSLDGLPIVLGGLHQNDDPTSATNYVESRRFYVLDGENLRTEGNVNRGVARGRAYGLGDEVAVTGGIPSESSAGHANIGRIRNGPSGVVRTGAERMRSPRVGHAGVVDAEGRVVAIGGLAGGDSYVTATPSASVEADRIDAATTRWAQLPDLPDSLGLADAVLLPRGAIVVIGGTSAPLERAEGRAAVLVLEPGAVRWTQVATLSQGRYAHGVALLPDGSILVAGGLRAPGDPVLEVERITVP